MGLALLYRLSGSNYRELASLTNRFLTQSALQVKEDSTGNVKIASSHAGKDFAAEEISAQVLRKLTDDAAKFLNDKVGHSIP